MAPGRGRKSSLVWTYVFETSSDSFQCVFCQSRYRRNATQIKTHLIEKCNLCPDDIKANLSSETERFTHKKANDGDSDSKTSSHVDGSNDKFAKESIKRRQFKANKGVSGIIASGKPNKQQGNTGQPEETDDLKILFARAVYSSSLPHHFVENDHWKKFFQRLRPDFTLPTRAMLNTSLLDNEYRNIMKATEAYMSKSECLTIAIDGFSNVFNDGIINIIICTPSPIFHSSIDTKTNPHTPEYLLALLKPIIEDKGCENFAAIISDNAAEMRILGQISRTSFPHILTFGCAAYCLGLLMDDITRIPEIAQILNVSRNISSEIKRSHILNIKFQEMAEKSAQANPNAPNASPLSTKSTRYSTYAKTITQLSTGKQILRSMALDPAVGLDPRNCDIILSPDFWDRIDHIKMILHTIQEYINMVEFDSSPISEIPTIFRAIQERFNSYHGTTQLFSALIPHILPLVESKKRLLTDMNPAYFLANVLDPRKKGADLTEPELQCAEKFLLEYARMIWANAESDIIDHLIRSFSNYTTKTGYFESDMVWKQSEIVGPLEWWKFIRRHESHRYLSEIGIKLLSIPSSNVTIEKNLLRHGHQPEKRKGRIDHNRFSKLIAIKSNLHLLETVSLNNRYEPSKTITPNIPTALTIVPDITYASDSDRSENEEANILGQVLAETDFHYEYNQQPTLMNSITSG